MIQSQNITPSAVIENVYDILTENQGSLDHTFKVFQKKFSSESFNLFSPCYVLLQALCDNVWLRMKNIKFLQVLSKGQRLLALFIINDSFKLEKYNPFTISLLDICEQSTDHYEKKIIYDLVIKNCRDQYASLSLKSILEEQDKFLDTFKNDDEIEQLKKSLTDSLQYMPTAAQTQIRNVIYDSINIDQKNDAPLQTPPYYKFQNIEREFIGFEPDILRPIPQVTPIQIDDIKWLDAGVFVEVLWDYNISVNNNTLSMVKELMQKAYQQKLNPDEIKALTDAFKKDQNCVQKCGLTIQLLPQLVEQNPTLASLLLTKMHGYPNITEYFEKLCQIEVTLASLEVINKLANTVSLPKEFFHFFITNCIHQCNNQKDKANSNRLVRLVCVFIKAMIKQKNINPKDLFIELQAFCIEYSKINEASNLFKILKSYENEEKKNTGQS